MKHKNHLLWMLIGCILPLVIILFAPLIGLGQGTSLLIFIVAMFACHLFMMGGHEKKHQQQTNEQDHHSHSS